MFAYRCVLYRLYNGHGVLLYIGISGDVHKRLSSHARTQSWWPEVESCRVEFFPTREVLVEAERAAIRDEHPRYNVVGRTQVEESVMDESPRADKRVTTCEVHPDGLVIDGQKITGLTVVESSTTMGVKPTEVTVDLRIAIRADAVTVHSDDLIPCVPDF